LAPAADARHAWTVAFLAKVVASWELVFAQELRAAAAARHRLLDSSSKREREKDGGAAEDEGQSNRRRRRTAESLKREIPASSSYPLDPTAPEEAARDLAQLTRLDVDVVYHEY
jgi:hypothetical protein